MAFKGFFHGVLQRNYRKNDLAWSFSYNSFEKLSIYKMIHLYYGSYQLPMDPKLSLMKGLHFNLQLLQQIIFGETNKIFLGKKRLGISYEFSANKISSLIFPDKDVKLQGFFLLLIFHMYYFTNRQFMCFGLKLSQFMRFEFLLHIS